MKKRKRMKGKTLSSVFVSLLHHCGYGIFKACYYAASIGRRNLVEERNGQEQNRERYLTVGRFRKLGKGYERCCGPTAITNLIMSLQDEKESPEEIFLSVARTGIRRGIYMNMDLFKRFGGTSNVLTEPYIKRCLKQHGVQAELHYLGRLTEERLQRALRRGSYLYLELLFHPKYGNHHVLCYGARPAKDGWLLRIADG